MGLGERGGEGERRGSFDDPAKVKKNPKIKIAIMRVGGVLINVLVQINNKK